MKKDSAFRGMPMSTWLNRKDEKTNHTLNTEHPSYCECWNTLREAALDMLEALEACKHIMSYYHKSEQGHLDSCENPDCCGHCQAIKLTNAAINKAKGE